MTQKLFAGRRFIQARPAPCISPRRSSHHFQEQFMSSQHTVIVGGSSGVGLATAQQLIAEGEQVTVTGRSQDRLNAAKASLGSKGRAVRMDAADAKSLPDVFAAIGPFDHLVLALGSRKGFGPSPA
jgi:NADP-dependent 3-hydroxy acid dehydrogenase YdfG